MTFLGFGDTDQIFISYPRTKGMDKFDQVFVQGIHYIKYYLPKIAAAPVLRYNIPCNIAASDKMLTGFRNIFKFLRYNTRKESQRSIKLAGQEAR